MSGSDRSSEYRIIMALLLGRTFVVVRLSAAGTSSGLLRDHLRKFRVLSDRGDFFWGEIIVIREELLSLVGIGGHKGGSDICGRRYGSMMNDWSH